MRTLLGMRPPIGSRLRCMPLCVAAVCFAGGGVLAIVDTVRTAQYAGQDPLEWRGALDLQPKHERYEFSRQMYEALALFAHWANTVHGGVHVGSKTRPLDLVTYEAVSTEAAMQATATRLLHRSEDSRCASADPRGVFYYAPYGSAMSEVVANVTERGRSLLLAGASSSTSVFKDRNYAFGTLSPAVLRFVHSVRLFRDQGANSAVCFTSVANGASGVERCRRALDEARQLGMRCDGVRVVPTNSSAAAEMMRNVRFGGVSGVNSTGEPDLVIADFGKVEVTMFVSIAKQLDWSVKALVITQESDVPDGDDGDYVSYTTPWHPRLVPNSSEHSEQFGPTPSEFDQMYRAQWGREPEYQAASTFATGVVLLRAIESCGCTDPDGVAAALMQLRLHTSYGLVRFDENRQNMGIYHTLQKGGHDPMAIVFPAPTWKRRACERTSLGKDKCLGLGGCLDDGSCRCTAGSAPSPDGACLPASSEADFSTAYVLGGAGASAVLLIGGLVFLVHRKYSTVKHIFVTASTEMAKVLVNLCLETADLVTDVLSCVKVVSTENLGRGYKLAYMVFVVLSLATSIVTFASHGRNLWTLTQHLKQMVIVQNDLDVSNDARRHKVDEYEWQNQRGRREIRTCLLTLLSILCEGVSCQTRRTS